MLEGNGVCKSISASISEISSENPFGSCVSPEFDGSAFVSSVVSRRRCIMRRPITRIRQRRTVAVTIAIKYQ